MLDPDFDPNEGFGALLFPILGITLFGCVMFYCIVKGVIFS